ncbi:hypothetical protein VKT23_008875 [Stygiomarasmius scandens]|uniref:Cytochrome P450 n=1 Tax=Marasmiellus scandens TaxID=2682957 RepID=A0ABR1JJ52_9AGAR
MKSWHDKYGPVVRTGPNEVSITDVDAMQAVLGTSGFPKGQFYDGRWDPKAPAGSLIILQGEEHTNRRRLWTRGMSPQSLKEYERLIGKRVNLLIEKLEALAGIDSSIDLAAWISYFTFDFMGDMMFGGGFELLRDSGDKNGLLEVMKQFAIAVQVICHIPWAATVMNKIPVFGRNTKRLRAFGVEAATRRVKMGASSKDLWYHLTDEAGFEKVRPSLASVVADGALAIVAGADTTVSALSSLFYFLLSNPNHYKKLQEEVDTVYPPGSDPLDVSKHSELKYMNACINEALRLQPPVSTNGPRSSDGRVLAGHFVPPGTQVYVPPYSLHRDPRYFSSPNEFLPERWLDPTTSNVAAFIPFSYGPANCVGKVLARQEMFMVTSTLLQKFYFSFAKGFRLESWPENLRDHFVTTRGPLLVNIRTR